METAFPRDSVSVTIHLVVSDLGRARDFYRDRVGASVYREYGGTSCVLQVYGIWLLLATGGGPTEDKPTVTFAAPADHDRVDHGLILGVPDCRKAYEALRVNGVEFLTPPVDHGFETRCFFRDPDGHLWEISSK